MGFGRCDFRKLQKLADNIEALRNGRVNDFTESAVREIALRLLRRVKQKTPVKEGALKDSWDIGEVKRTGNTYTIEIINPIEYASYVEYGHRQTPGRYVPAIGKRLKASWVNGKFMLTISLSEIESQIPAIVEDKIWRELRRCFNNC